MSYRKTLKTGAAICAPLLVVGAFALFYPDWIVAALAKRSPEVLYFVRTREPVVALTIDDGPDTISTPRILDVLRQHGARATFFLLASRIPGNEEVVARIVEENHELANHLTKDEPSIRLSPSEFEQQLLEAHAVLSEFAGIRSFGEADVCRFQEAGVQWFRPGSGWYNAAMLSTLCEHGYRCVLGSVYPFDPQIPSLWFSTHYVLWNVRPGSIVVLHDHGARGERTAKALATILPELDRRGFRVVTVSELLDSSSPGK